MVKFLCTPSSIATSGERTFYNRVEEFFATENHVIGYYEPDIGEFHPDFVLISPKYGVIIVEIKDYSEKYLKSINRSGKWERLKNEDITLIENPFDQMYQYWRVIKDRVDYCHFPNDLKVPITRLVVFSQVKQSGYTAAEIKKIAPKKIYLCFRETLGRKENFNTFFMDILPVNIQLSDKFFQVLRANIIPTCRLPTPTQENLLEYFDAEDKIKLLDQEQERMARELGEGHRLIFGVAGSGKTVLLIARARILAKRHPDWKILILCFNRLLKAQLFNLLNPQDYEADITISTYHAWVRSYIFSADNEFSSLYQEAQRKAEKEDNMTDFFQKFVPQLLLQMLNTIGSKRICYDAILIDEAQDFDEDWFKPLIEVLNPQTSSLLITCDGIQGIYARNRFTWSSVGIQARGRVKRFEKSYRMPIEIGNLAQAALPNSLKELIDKFDEFISTKEFLGAHGTVEIILSETRREEYMVLAEKIAQLLKTPQEILVLFRYNMEKRNYDSIFFEYLKDLGIKWKSLQDYDYRSPGLLIGTLHGTKGLESDIIIIPELDKYNSDEDRQLLYVGITRSRKKLILSANKSTKLIKTLVPYQSQDSI